MVEYWDRLESLMGEGWDASRLAKELKVSYQAIKKVRDGGSLGSKNNLKAAKLFKVNPDWLATGLGPKTLLPSTAAHRWPAPPPANSSTGQSGAGNMRTALSEPAFTMG